jgi:tRNA(fMet)-specific endonuclease VapC
MDANPQADARVAELQPTDLLLTCVVVRGEVLYGLARMAPGRRRLDFEARAANLFSRVPCEPVPVPAGDIYARIKLDAERQGTPIDDNDLWIAATCLHLGARLVTSDTDFQRVKNLPVEDWTR